MGNGLLAVLRERLHLDAWQNLVTGVGSSLRDKALSTLPVDVTLDDNTLDLIFANSALGRRIVAERWCDATRRGLRLSFGDGRERLTEAVAHDLVRLRAPRKLREGAIFGSLFGGCLVVMGIDDGRPMWAPVDRENVRSVRYLEVLDRRYVSPRRVDSDQRSADYGLADLFDLFPFDSSGAPTSSPRSMVTIHRSRCIVFGGAITTAARRAQNGGWDDSVLKSVWDVLQQDAFVWSSAFHLVGDASQAVWKIKGLLDILAGKRKEEFRNRMALTELTRSVARAILIDSEGEEFERKQTPMGGVPEMLDRAMFRLAAAVYPHGMPVTKLFCRSPAGENATGESDDENWDDTVEDARTETMGPAYEELATNVARGFGAGADDRPTIAWPTLRRPKPGEDADIRLKTAQRDAIYVGLRAVSGAAIALSRFGHPEGYSVETDVDVAHLRAVVAHERERELAALRPAEPTALPAGAPATPALPEGEVAKVPDTALNGAQVAELLAVVESVAQGRIPRATGVQILVVAFRIEVADAEALMGETGRGFTPSAPEPSPAPTPPNVPAPEDEPADDDELEAA